MRRLILGCALSLSLVSASCVNDTVGLRDDVTVTESPITEGEVYSGSRGIVVDVRELARKGYLPTAVDISFPDHANLNATIAVDERTHYAILVLENDSDASGRADTDHRRKAPEPHRQVRPSPPIPASR